LAGESLTFGGVGAGHLGGRLVFGDGVDREPGGGELRAPCLQRLVPEAVCDAAGPLLFDPSGVEVAAFGGEPVSGGGELHRRPLWRAGEPAQLRGSQRHNRSCVTAAIPAVLVVRPFVAHIMRATLRTIRTNAEASA
jgi:hypothetical protein